MIDVKRCFITGASGFLGTNLSNYLRNHKIDIQGFSFKESKLEEVDLSTVDVFIHLAGLAHDIQKNKSFQDYYDINVGLTRQSFSLFLESRAQKFVFISSVKAVADNFEDALTELTTPDPKTHYGKSKLLAEKDIMFHYPFVKKSCFILRPCMIHGPGNKGNLNLLHNFVSKGIPYPLAAFSNRRSFLSVENLCFIIKELIERDDIPSGIYNVADDEPLSTNEVVSLLAQAGGKSPRLWKVPKSLVQKIARIGDRLRLPLTTERLEKLTENFVVSNEKIKTALKKELPLSAREGILRTARSFER